MILASSRFGSSRVRCHARPGDGFVCEGRKNFSWSGALELIEAAKSTEAKANG
jgi:hypothetical protein